MTYKEILKLPEGAHLTTVNTEKCMVIRLREDLYPDNRSARREAADPALQRKG